jgi:hypothetical protein
MMDGWESQFPAASYDPMTDSMYVLPGVFDVTLYQNMPQGFVNLTTAQDALFIFRWFVIPHPKRFLCVLKVYFSIVFLRHQYLCCVLLHT